jgi:hypothetical protein
MDGAEDHPIQPSILVARKRTRGEAAVQLARDQNVTSRRRRAVPLQLQPLAPQRPDTPPANDSGFQDTLLAEGCGTQVQRYVYPFYSPGHILNQHLFCHHVGSS